MAIVKSFFISIYVAFIGFAASFTVFTFLNNDDSVYWFSSALSTAIPAFYFIYVTTKKPSDVQLLKMLVLPMVGAAMLISLGKLYFDGEELTLPARLAMISFFGWLLYDKWYTKLPTAPKEMKSDVNLWSFHDAAGNEVVPSKGTTKLRMFVFIRGSWSSFCMAQLRDIGKEFDSIHAMGAQVNFVTHKADKFIVSAIEKLNPKINLLEDKNLLVSTQIGLAHKSATPIGLQLFGYESSEIRPAVVIANEKGEILKTYFPKDYRNRPEPAWFLRLMTEYASKTA